MHRTTSLIRIYLLFQKSKRSLLKLLFFLSQGGEGNHHLAASTTPQAGMGLKSHYSI